MSKIMVMGHTPPDTDSTCAPIVYSWYLNEIAGQDAEAIIGDEINNETKYVLDRFGIEKPIIVSKLEEGQDVVIVDTNNPEELIDGYENTNILEIIDHHKLSGLTTNTPLSVVIEPLACTMSVMWSKFTDEAIEKMPKHIAGLMLSAIVSDTLKFTSPTTTEFDIDVAGQLAEISGIDIEELADGMFAAKSDLTGMTVREILLSDHKDYEFNGKKYKVGVLETTDPNQAMEKREELVKEMSELKSENGLDSMFFFVVNILTSESNLVVPDDSERKIAEKAFEKSWEGDSMLLPGVVSRKKQMVPNLEKAAK